MELDAEFGEVNAMAYQSISDHFMKPADTSPSPFQASPLAYGSELDKESTSHFDHDEVVKPTDRESMIDFIDQTTSKSEWLLNFKLPTVHLVLPNRNFFELLINRLTCDLLLWQPTTFSQKAGFDPTRFRVHAPGLDQSSFKKYSTSGNDSDTSDEDEEPRMCSVYELYKKRQPAKKDGLTNIATTIAITKGRLLVHTPLEETNMCGKLQLDIEEGCLFFASSYNGDPNETYFCAMAEKSILFHNGRTSCDLQPSVVQPMGRSTDESLTPIIYVTENGLLLNSSARGDMLRIAVHGVHNPKQQLKVIKVAIEISEATLRHYTEPVQQIWVNQMMDFLRTQTYPIEGYVPSAVVTELHVNLSHSAVDYRPLNLPLRSMLTVDNFNMSCNIAATTPSFLFRIISDEMRFFLSTALVEKLNLKNDYVCIIDTGLIDVSFRTSMDKLGAQKMELCATNNLIHLRTCSDSFKALLDFIIYVSNNGDVQLGETVEKEEEVEEAPNVTYDVDADLEHVNRKMAEAMNDCPRVEMIVDSSSSDSGSPSEMINPDDEFIILGDDPGVGLTPRNGEPVIRMLTDEPIVIVEDYFSVPPGKQDVMKAPKHYPPPLVSLQLREMTLVWFLYGGSDFAKIEKEKKSRTKEATVNFADERSVHMEGTKVTFNKTADFSFSRQQLEPEPKESWLQKGGPLRDRSVLMELHINKIKFLRELYSPEGEYASRYVLLAYDIEIRDRLECSDINHFLYQYTTEQMPRQTSANMIEVKAVYTRPDPNSPSEECSIKVSCKPLRLNIDQDALYFLITFFQEVAGQEPGENCEETDIKEKNHNSPVHHLPLRKQRAKPPTETFYKYFCFSPDLLIKIDYKSKHVSMEKGVVEGILLGMTNLTSTELRIRRLCNRHGLLGHGRVLQYALTEWHQDIIKTQLQNILVGVGPMNTFATLFSGFRDLLVLPVEQYRRDGQIVRGLQRGASSFSTSALVATLDLFSALVNTIQHAAIVGFDLVSPGPSVCQDAYRLSTQPADIREGLTTALNVVKEGLEDTARTIRSAATSEHEHKGVRGAVGGVLRQIPPTLLRPIIVTSEATSYVLDGVRHQLMPDAHKEDIHKWRTK